MGHIHSGLLDVEDIVSEISYSQDSFREKIELLKIVGFELKNVLDFANSNRDKINSYYSNRSHFFPDCFHSCQNRTYKISLYHAVAKSIFDLFLKLSQVDAKNSEEQFEIRSVGVSFAFGWSQEIDSILTSYIQHHIDEINFKGRYTDAYN